MKKPTNEDLVCWAIAALVIVLFLASVVGVAWFFAKQESATYNRLTGAHTTTWDALWVDLRVISEPLK